MTKSVQELLDEQAADIPEGWRPTEGDQLTGVVTNIQTGTSQQNESTYPILVIHEDNQDKDISIHCFHHVLKNKVIELKPQIDDRIGIKYKGKVPQAGNPSLTVALYDFVVEGRTADYSSYTRTYRLPDPTVVAELLERCKKTMYALCEGLPNEAVEERNDEIEALLASLREKQ